ncbi:hypothetical protein HWV62_25468 [Athelia sp. TMB]|nr:hypothetical protein HWV62_25468 [Athelia sp. TMB]
MPLMKKKRPPQKTESATRRVLQGLAPINSLKLRSTETRPMTELRIFPLVSDFNKYPGHQRSPRSFDLTLIFSSTLHYSAQMDSAPTWTSLPTEMRMAIVNCLDFEDVKSLSKVNTEAYYLSVPVIFQNVRLPGFEALQRFLERVPSTYYQHILQLSLSTEASGNLPAKPHPRTDAVVSLLSGCIRIQDLTLHLDGALANHAIPTFSNLPSLKHLAISNCAPEEEKPISERFVVSIAALLPALEQLTLNRISRSILHAPELVGAYPYVPIVSGDQDIAGATVFGTDLSLPSLLRIASLRKLTIRETHLGDPAWLTVSTACRLEVLDLGSCPYETDDANSLFIERIMSTLGPSVNEASLSTAIADESFAKSSATPLPQLRKLHISPFFPVDSVVDTMSNLSGSPIESVSVRCFEDDVIDVCEAVESFLSLRVERGPNFYRNLARVAVNVAEDQMGLGAGDAEDAPERARAAKRLQELCMDLRLESLVCGSPAYPACDPPEISARKPSQASSSAISPT